MYWKQSALKTVEIKFKLRDQKFHYITSTKELNPFFNSGENMTPIKTDKSLSIICSLLLEKQSKNWHNNASLHL